MPCAADPSFLFSSPSHLFPNPVFLLVFPFCSRTGEKGLITNTKQVQKTWLHQQVRGAEVSSPTPSFCSPCLPPLTSAQHSVGGTGVRYLAAGKRGKSEVRKLAGKSTSAEAEIRWELKSSQGKRGNARKAPPLMGDSATCRYGCFKLTSTLPNFQKASSEKAAAWSRGHPSGGATDPRILAVLS